MSDRQISRRPRGRTLVAIAACSIAAHLAACNNGGSSSSTSGGLPFQRTETREPCSDYSAEKRPLFGDLHVHTGLSFDAYIWDNRNLPDDAYRFGRGQPIHLEPLDENGQGTRVVQLARPLDFMADTDHAEFFGEVQACIDPKSKAYPSDRCVVFREGDNQSTIAWGTALAPTAPERFPAVCGKNGVDCAAAAGDVWKSVQDAAEQNYDRTSACQFTTLVGYEWSGANSLSSIHRNVIFRNASVPALPITHFEQPLPEGLWGALKEQCLDAGTGCDVLAVPHNSNLSNGRQFNTDYMGLTDIEDQRSLASLRNRLEPLMEIFQHKGESECSNHLPFPGLIGEPDELCSFEEQRPTAETCSDGEGLGGVIGSGNGCVSYRDFLRGALLTGMQEEMRLGVNPFRLGVIASTDTHNATPGATEEDRWEGHSGDQEDTVVKRLTPAGLLPGGLANNPGGLAGVWAEENSRDAIFEALRRRETFGTSGPRISVRFFGGWKYPAELCSNPDLVKIGYRDGVPMGGDLPKKPNGAAAPTFAVAALRDPDLADRPGTPLQRLQVVKGWIDAGGEPHQQVFDVAGDPSNGASVDLDTCETRGTGADDLCSVWTDPTFEESQHAYYYARAVENPTCRWSTYQCLSLAPADRPPACSDSTVAKTGQERAWTSPIWYTP